ncbi:hypothetical protein FJZ33_03695 [Candidatus Poribacteria bacterium]|nr:hypothetical protein [Candidatus Poribacteria bacterium]
MFFTKLINRVRMFEVNKLNGKNEGYALLSVVVVSAISLIFASSMLSVAFNQIKDAERWKKSNEAYFLARSGVSESVYRLKTDYTKITANGYIGSNTTNIPLLSGDTGKNYSFTIQPLNSNNLHFIGSKYMTGSFKINATGNRVLSDTQEHKKRGIEAIIERDTFLRYSRFVQQGNLSYGANANILADVYVGGNLNLNGSPVEFWGDIEVGNTIVNKLNGIYHGDITGVGTGIDLQKSVDINYYKQLSQGLISGEGTGQYLSTARSINLSLYDFSDPNNPKYNGTALPSGFNGIVYCESDISVNGFLEGSYIGPNGAIYKGLTFVSNDNIIITGDIRTGNTLTGVSSPAPLTFNSASGIKQTQTVSLNGIVDQDTNTIKFKINSSVWQKMKMTILKNGNPMINSDGNVVQTQIVRTTLASGNSQTAAINGNDLGNVTFDTFNNYSAQIEYFSSGTGNTTVQIDSCKGDPVNVGFVSKNQFSIHQNTAKQIKIDAVLLSRDSNWTASGDSSSHPDGFDTNVWEFTINGPIITMTGGDAGPWSSYGIRNYRYDMDLVEHAPPAFPVPSDWWVLASWRNLKESEIR